MEAHKSGYYNVYFSYNLWNVRKFTSRRIKALHIVGWYNAAVLSFLAAQKNLLIFDSLYPVLLICILSIGFTLVGIGAEIPGLSYYFDRLETLFGHKNQAGRNTNGPLHDLGMGSKLPIQRSGIVFYALLLCLWVFLLIESINKSHLFQN